MIFNMNGGGNGAAALNFKVVGGTSAPSNPAENTIWVNTSTAVTGWDFSATQPYPRSTNKNIIVYPYVSDSTTKSGITWTVNSDGSIKANGTATANSSRYITHKTTTGFVLTLPAGTYRLSGCPSGGSSSTYFLELAVSYDNWATTTYPKDTGSGTTITLTSTAKVCMYALVKSGKTVSNIVFKPQLEVGSSATSWVKGDATGHVWICTSKSSNVEFNALKTNGIQTYPVSAKQYSNGAWVDKAAKIYQSGAWKDWVPEGALFYKGNYCEHITGGWEWVPEYTVSGAHENGCPAGEMSITDGGYLRCIRSTTVNASDEGMAMFRTKNQIDLTDYKTLTCKNFNAYVANHKAAVAVGKNKEYLDNFPAKWLSGNPCNVTNQTINIDVSGLSGAYYIIILVGWWGDWDDSGLSYVETDEIILTK